MAKKPEIDFDELSHTLEVIMHGTKEEVREQLRTDPVLKYAMFGMMAKDIAQVMHRVVNVEPIVPLTPEQKAAFEAYREAAIVFLVSIAPESQKQVAEDILRDRVDHDVMRAMFEKEQGDNRHMN